MRVAILCPYCTGATLFGGSKIHQSTTIYQGYQGVHDLVHISLMLKNVEKNPVNHGQNPQRKTPKNHISKRALEAAEPNKGVEPPGWGW